MLLTTLSDRGFDINQIKQLELFSPDKLVSYGTGFLDNLLSTYGIKTVHLTAVLELKELMTGIVKMFSLSPYLTRIFLSSHYYLNILIEEWAIFKTLNVIEQKQKIL